MTCIKKAFNMPMIKKTTANIQLIIGEGLALSFMLYDQLPPKGVPKIPTASSAQTRKSAIKILIIMEIRYSDFFIILSASSIAIPEVRRRISAMPKSDSVQFTSSVNCIAIKGISNRADTAVKMIISLLFCTSIIILFFQKL